MKLILNTPRKSLNKAYLKEKINRIEIEQLKKNILEFESRINEQESEEYLKNVVADFLKDTWYKGSYEINTKDRKDLVIHVGKSSKETVGVILEVKKPSNKLEMISEVKPNVKAMHELILYYLRERIELNNIDIKYLIATNIYNWFIFDEIWFEKNVFRNNRLKKDYANWKMSGKDTRFFYESIAKPFLETVEAELVCTYFDIRSFTAYAKDNDKSNDSSLVILYKILSPIHLLKQPFANDSNSLDTNFYDELLHIIGLEEIKKGNKKVITRKAEASNASFIENTMLKLKDRDCLRNISNLYSYGHQQDEQLYSVALELSITWINRLLFLKLLEAQLYRYHNGNKEYLFLNTHTIYDFDELSNLFFQVLAERRQARRADLKEKFNKVPYLNSSLFERTDLERQTIDVSNLDNRLHMPLHKNTVLKDQQAKRRVGTLTTLQYLFEFLDAYDFKSEGIEEIQEENKNLISASVLGLIFEKINGYKEGAFFTPGFVTMYMCRQTLRRAVIQKFNEVKKWNCQSTRQLYDKIEDKHEANKIINSITICDPAVGSGHFLVSALNELIVVKSELKILLDKQGKTLRDYHVEVVNDELLVSYEEDLLVDYIPKNKESQRLQEALFHEKETIIENCLFGVDINPNSVKICRLRLWIELLKNAYYTVESNYSELETLPNIDINIKCGNSLISRFPLDADVKGALKKSNRWTIDSYKLAVQTYREADSKEQKREMEDLIETIKKDFNSEISVNDPKVKKLSKLRGELFNLSQTKELFDERDNKNNKITKQRIDSISKELTKIEKEIEEIKNNKIFHNSFEWRFEFPEILDDNGNFTGFDIVIGNPPWGAEIEKNTLSYIKNANSDIIVRMTDSFMFFVNQSLQLKKENGFVSIIVPDVILYQVDNAKLRSKILETTQILEVINLGDNIFQDVARASTIILIGREADKKILVGNYRKRDGKSLNDILLEEVETSIYRKLPYCLFATENIDHYQLLAEMGSTTLKNLVDDDEIQRGISPDYKKAFIVTDSIVDDYNLEREKIKTTITGGVDLKKYQIITKSKRIIYTSSKDRPDRIPNIVRYIEQFKDKITCREVAEGKHPFYALHRERDEKIFIKPEKVVGVITGDEIIVAMDSEQTYPTDGLYVLNGTSGVSNEYLLAVLNSKISTFIYRLFSFEEGRTMAQIKPSLLKDIPIPKLLERQQQPFKIIVQYITFLLNSKDIQLLSYTSNERIAFYFQEVLNMMVYELYFENHMKEKGIDVLQFIDPIPMVSLRSDFEKREVIKNFYLWLQKPENPARQRMLLVDTRSKDKLGIINKAFINE